MFFGSTNSNPHRINFLLFYFAAPAFFNRHAFAVDRDLLVIEGMATVDIKGNRQGSDFKASKDQNHPNAHKQK